MTRFVRAIVALCSLAFAPGAAWAHGSLRDRSARADQAVQARPQDGEALVARAELELEAGSAARAIVDLERAHSLGDCAHATDADRARCQAVELLLAEAYLAADDGASAEEVLARLLVESPNDRRALYLRARAASADARYADAARDLESSLAVTSAPAPSAYVELAGLYVADGNDDAAISVLERAAERLGPLVVLVDAAIDIELRRGRPAQALSWTDRWEERVRASPAGRAVRSELLLAVDRAGDAELEAALGLSAVEALPSTRRSAVAIVEVEARLRATMDEVRRASAEPTPSPLPPAPGRWWLVAATLALLLLAAVGLRRSRLALRLEAR